MRIRSIPAAARPDKPGIWIAILPGMFTPTRRRALIPRSAIIATAVSVALIAAAIAASVYWTNSRVVSVPDVTGLPREIAERAFEVSSLTPSVVGTRVSVDIPAGAVVSQDPPAGTEVRRGSEVRLVLSAGPQSFALPDVVGMHVEEARAELVSRGLVVNVIGVSAEASAGIVVEMFPSPGTSVNTGDVIRLSVPGGSDQSDMLLPYDLTGVRVVLDPAPPQTADPGDPAIDVTRRLSALLQAAGASVTVTRSATDTAPIPEARLGTARSSGADLFIGIDAGRSSEAGLRALHRASNGTSAAALTASIDLARSVTRAAQLPGISVLEPRASSDPVLAGFPQLGIRVIVGDVTAEADRVRMTDPAWADSVARAVYRGVGTVLASR
jgi:hypothetical protein